MSAVQTPTVGSLLATPEGRRPTLQRMLSPKAVALISATEAPNSVGRMLMENLLSLGENLYPINPKRPSVTKAFPHIADGPAGELTPFVLHVAARSIAARALSIFRRPQSNATQTLLEGHETRHSSYLEHQGYLLFEKLSMELTTLFKLIPGTKPFGDCDTQRWDFSSAAVLGRQILEDCVTFLYLIEPKLLVEQMQFREMVWRYHADKESVGIADLYGFLSAPLGPQNSVIALLKRQAEERLPGSRKKVENHPCLNYVDAKLRGQIKKGKANLVLYDGAVLSRFGITKPFYDAPYKNLSQFVHTSAYSLNQLPHLKTQSSLAEAHFHLVCIFVNFLFAPSLDEAIRRFGGTKSLNKKIEFIRTRNRGVFETGQNYAAGRSTHPNAQNTKVL